jgi:hypothetical protein
MTEEIKKPEFLPDLAQMLTTRAVEKVEATKDDAKESFDNLGLEEAKKRKKSKRKFKGRIKRVVRGKKVIKKRFAKNAADANANSGRSKSKRRADAKKQSRRLKKVGKGKFRKAAIKRKISVKRRPGRK